MSHKNTEGYEPHDRRTVRAATEYLTVLPKAPGVYRVVSGSGNGYVVDTEAGVCTCPDARYHDPGEGCKHLRRVQMETGARAIPDSLGPEMIPSDFGEHVESDLTPARPDGGQTEDDNSCLCDRTEHGPGCFQHFNGE
jgi:hypothetical protein